FEAYRREQEERNQEPWYPFESKDEWELARWLMTSGVSIDPAFHNSRALLKRIDALPEGPEWTCTPFRITGDKLDKKKNPRTEDVELW
ncbi:hypothetical protein BDZ97DRAFT_1613670, partial [Flammula alnicola]